MLPKPGFQLSSATPFLDTPQHIRQTFRKLARMGCRDAQLQSIPLEIPDVIVADALADAGLRCVATQEDSPSGSAQTHSAPSPEPSASAQHT